MRWWSNICESPIDHIVGPDLPKIGALCKYGSGAYPLMGLGYSKRVQNIRYISSIIKKYLVIWWRNVGGTPNGHIVGSDWPRIGILSKYGAGVYFDRTRVF